MTDFSKELSGLSPDARARVETALKATLDQQLKREASASKSDAAAFSRGVLFSKSSDRVMNLDESILPALTEMDDAKFRTFIDRVTQLKNAGPK